MTTKEIKIQIALGSLSFEDIVKLARGRKTSKKILTILSKDKDWFVRQRVAKNLNTPIEVLKILSTDEDSSVKSWAFELRKDK
jgi:3-methyladenine DNA glycosylase AlkC